MALTPEDDDEEMIYYEPTPTQKIVDVNVIYLSSLDYSLVANEEISQMDFGPQDDTF
jgi:hypothetical protein